MKNLAKLCIFLCLIFAVLGQNVIPPEIATEIDALIVEAITKQHIPALGISIVKGDKANDGPYAYVFEKGYGLRNIEANENATEHTLFGIGSVTKSFTATVVVRTLNQLFPDRGELVLDTPIRVLAPSYNFTLGDDYRSEQTSFRDLLAHRVCTLPEYVGMWVGAFEDEEDFYSRQRFAPELCAVRNGFWYNNGLIGLAGDVVGHLVGKPFGELLAQFLTDVGMTSTTWIKASDDHNNMPNRSIPYLWKDNAHLRYNTELIKTVEVVNAAGGILSSASDMAKYMEFHLSGGKSNGAQVIPEEVLSWMYKVSNPLFGGTFKTEAGQNNETEQSVGYSLCLMETIYDGFFRIEHNGYIPPYATSMAIFPHLHLGIFTTSSGPGDIFAEELSHAILLNKIFDIVMGIERAESKSLSKPVRYDSPSSQLQLQKVDLLQPASIPGLTQQFMTGSYANGLNGQFNISLRLNPGTNLTQLYFEFGVWGLGWLTPHDTSNPVLQYIEWETDFWMMNWANMMDPLPKQLILFTTADTIVMGDDVGGIQSDVFHRVTDGATSPTTVEVGSSTTAATTTTEHTPTTEETATTEDKDGSGSGINNKFTWITVSLMILISRLL